MKDVHWLKLQYSDQGEPISPLFEDRYFSCGDGIEESEFVFFQANDLPQRWLEKENFTLAEVGFGTGLNFFLAAKKWSDVCKQGQVLSFISFEKFPIQLQDLEFIFASVLKKESLIPKGFLTAYAQISAGWNHLAFAEISLDLHLYVGDALEGLNSRAFFADTWFYDGFSPAHNPELWNSPMFKALAGHSHPGCTISTFTAVGNVRRGLAQHGFVMEKTLGFGRKRNMLRGHFDPDVQI